MSLVYQQLSKDENGYLIKRENTMGYRGALYMKARRRRQEGRKPIQPTDNTLQHYSYFDELNRVVFISWLNASILSLFCLTFVRRPFLQISDDRPIVNYPEGQWWTLC